MATTSKAPRMRVDPEPHDPESYVEEVPAAGGAAGPVVGPAAGAPSPSGAGPAAPRPEAPSAAGAGPATADEPSAGTDREIPTPASLGRGISAWVHRTFPGHEHAFWGAVIGLAVALLIFIIGIFRALFIVVLVGLGMAVGQYLDGDPRIMSIVQRLFGGR